jgi:hypothetical protein
MPHASTLIHDMSLRPALRNRSSSFLLAYSRRIASANSSLGRRGLVRHPPNQHARSLGVWAVLKQPWSQLAGPERSSNQQQSEGGQQEQLQQQVRARWRSASCRFASMQVCQACLGSGSPRGPQRLLTYSVLHHWPAGGRGCHGPQHLGGLREPAVLRHHVVGNCRAPSAPLGHTPGPGLPVQVL